MKITSDNLNQDKLTHDIDDAIKANDNKRLREIVSNTHYADLADYINFASQDQKRRIIRVAADKLDPHILLEFDATVLSSVRQLFTKKQFSLLISELDVQNIVQLFDDLPKVDSNAILSCVPTPKKEAVLKYLAYPKDSAGILMHDKYVAVDRNKTVAEALKSLIDAQDLPKECDEIFVVDSQSRPIGRVYVNTLIRSGRQQKIADIMDKDLQIISAEVDQEEVAYKFRHYDLTSAPVVDKRKRMVGIILVDQIVQVMTEETEEDILRSVGVNMSDIYLAFFKTAIKRFPWLFFNLITACLTSIIISKFKSQIEELVILAAILPIVASMGGNAGTQSATIAIRAIANKDIITSNWFQVISKEVCACAINGLVLGLLGGVILFLLYNNLHVCGVFALAVTINFVLAGFWGGMIPIVINKIGLDPAISSSVLLTFLTDFLGFFIFLSLASWLIL
jgi:magnesium transporter